MSPPEALVASGHPEVGKAAAEILTKGGNAFDAVVAAGFAATIAEPALTSLGGGGFLLARLNTGESLLFDFFTDTPGQGLPATKLDPHFFPVTVRFSGSDQDFNIGMGSVAVPGNLKGFLHVQERLGRLSLAEILAPAIRLADQGVKVRHQQAHFLKLLYPIMTLSPDGKAIFEPNGKYIACNDLFRNPDLADFLARLPQDRGSRFYAGDLARKTAADMKVGQGLLTEADLASYRVIERTPLTTSYRGFHLLTNPPPSLGGPLIAKALRLLEGLDCTGFTWGSPAHAAALAEVTRTVEQQRDTGLLDSEAFHEQWQRHAGQKLRVFSRGTTHVSIVDQHGNAASMTTSNGEGSGYIVPGTGIMLNNMMGEDDLHPDGFHASPPGQRVASMMSPSLLLANDAVKLVIGSGGSKRIRTAIPQVISHIVDFGLSVKEAVEAPRLHWDGAILQVEPGFGPETVAALQSLGPTHVWQRRNVYFGGVHAVVPGQGGAGDPRRGGDARSVRIARNSSP